MSPAEQKGMTMQQQVEYSSSTEFGSGNQIRVRLSQFDGPFQDQKMAATHLGLIIDTATKLEAITLVTEDRWNSGKTEQTIKAAYESGDIKVGIEIDFKIADRQIPREDLEAIVHGNIMPAALQTVGYYRGDGQLVAKPATGFNAVSSRSSSLLGRLDEVLEESSAQRTRQRMTR